MKILKPFLLVALFVLLLSGRCPGQTLTVKTLATHVYANLTVPMAVTDFQASVGFKQIRVKFQFYSQPLLGPRTLLYTKYLLLEDQFDISGKPWLKNQLVAPYFQLVDMDGTARRIYDGWDVCEVSTTLTCYYGIQNRDKTKNRRGSLTKTSDKLIIDHNHF